MTIASTFTSLFTPDLFAAMLRIATPIALAALGAAFTERAGVINIGLEGMMLSGAFAAVAFVHLSGSIPVGVIGAVGVGGLMAFTLAFGSISLGANQIVLGAAVNIFALGLTGFLTTVVFNSPGSSERVAGWGAVDIPGLSHLPWLGPILFAQTPTVYVALALVAIGHFVLFRTPWGAWIRAAGDHPLALHSAGISVNKVRYAAVVTSGCLAGLGGSYLSLEVTHLFSANITAGRGFIGLAANIFGNWTPLGGLGGSLLFGFAEALQLKSSILAIPPEVLLMLPFLLTLVVLVGVMGRARAPRVLGQRYEAG